MSSNNNDSDDVSQAEEEDVESWWLPPEESVAVTSVAVVLSSVAIISNSLLIYVVVRTAALRTPANFFIASLSAAELLTGLFVIPFAGFSASVVQWTFSSHLCRFVGVVSVLGPCASALSLLAVSTDRCLAVSKPFSYASLITRTSTIVVIFVVWAWSLLMSILPLLSWGRYEYSRNFRICTLRSTSSGSSGVPEVVVKEVLCNFIPMVLIIFTVLKSVHHIRMHRRVFAFVPALVAVTSVPAITNNMNARGSNVKASRTLLLVLAVFVTFCMPSAVASILCQRPSSCHVTSRLLRTLLWLSFLSCVFHPVIIMTLNRKFRSKVSSLFYQTRCWKILQTKTEKVPFTISTGLQTVLEASLFVNVVKTARAQETAVPRTSTYLTVLPSYMDRLTVNPTVQPSVMEPSVMEPSVMEPNEMEPNVFGHSNFLQVPQPIHLQVPQPLNLATV